MDDKTVKKIKDRVSYIARRDHWMLDQVQFAEDYIDDLIAGKTQEGKRLLILSSSQARAIREAIKDAERPKRGIRRPS